ncbi:homeobox protein LUMINIDEPENDENS-like isoform X1 [Solanum lycopersicum]|uniref:homeobox protein LUMINIDEPENDENS-like isoform X1 n=2 Tax=Solanum lycopersicum TaxID=4081 RepID=UPI003747EFAD
MENQLQLALTSPTPPLSSLLDSQKELLNSQIHQLQNIVVQQCNLTGINPLSQEMAAGALSIKIGKRPRDLLNPKAIKYMQSVFSVKDAISKKEAHEISALFGVTVTQVRDFFTAQRTRVRKFLRLSREKPITTNLSIEGPIPLSSDPSSQTEPVPLDSVVPISTEDGKSCSTQDEVLTAMDERDRHFVDNILTLMCKEETFSGRVKLMDWILEVQNPSVLYWFLTKGGVMILSAWLSEAAGEEQTSVLHLILKVLCHLPLHKAFPGHMSAILQNVNSLRFYRTPDISDRARVLLERWSNIFAKSQAMTKHNGVKSASDMHDEMLLQQSISEVVGDEIWNSKIEDVEEAHANLCGTSENSRKLDSPQPVKLLMASSDDSNKRLKGASVTKSRERRKVQLMEQPSERTIARSLGRPAAPATQGRPLSADDIQKAKMREQFLKSKYGKTNNDDSSWVKPQAPNEITSSPNGILLGAPKLQDRPKVEECEKLNSVASQGSSQLENHLKLSLDVEEPPWKRCKKMQIPWKKPPGLQLRYASRVCAGGESKEVDVQNKRVRRETEAIYRTVQEIPLNPKEPWDPEMEPDDTLTTEVPLEQLPDEERAETGVLPQEDRETETAVLASTSNCIATTAKPDLELLATLSNGIATTAKPDLELLNILLKHPGLVYALTSGQGGNLLSEQIVKLLDSIKANERNSLSIQTNLARGAGKKVEVSLPSLTPSSDPGTSGLSMQNSVKNPFSQRSSMVVPEANDVPQHAGLVHSQETHQVSSLLHQQAPLVQQLAQQLALLQAAAASYGVSQHAVLVHSQEIHQASSLVHQQTPLLPQLARQSALLQEAAGSYGVPQHAPLVHSQEIHQASSFVHQQMPLAPQLSQQSAPLQEAAGSYGVPQRAPMDHSQEIHQASSLVHQQTPLVPQLALPQAAAGSYGVRQHGPLVHSQDIHQASSFVHQQMPLAPQLAQQSALLQEAAGSYGNDHRPSLLNPRINQTVLANPMHSQSSAASEPAVNRNNYFFSGSTEYNQQSATAARIQGVTYGNIRSSQMPIANVQQRTISLHAPQMSLERPQLQTQRQPGYAPEHIWGTIPGSALSRVHQENAIPNRYNPHVAGHVEPGLQQAAWRGNNNYAEGAGFESWRPDNRPVRRQEQVARWNYAEPQMNMRDCYRSDWSASSNPWHYSGYRGHADGVNERQGDGPDWSTSRNPEHYSGYRGRADGVNERRGDRRRRS